MCNTEPRFDPFNMEFVCVLLCSSHLKAGQVEISHCSEV